MSAFGPKPTCKSGRSMSAHRSEAADADIAECLLMTQGGHQDKTRPILVIYDRGAADPIAGTLHGSAVAIASAQFIPEILSTGNAIDARF
jgi:hypothetical protein